MSSDARTISLWPIATLAAWLTWLAAGVLGMALRYPAVRPPVEAEEFPPTQIVDAQLTPAPAPPELAPLPPPADQTPPAAPPSPAPALPPMPATPPLAAVALPSPAIAFALPTEGLTRIVDAGQAGYTRSALPAPASSGSGRGAPPPAPAPPAPKPQVAAPPAPVHLSLGEGEGRRIMPQYPRDAVLAQQEGTVAIRFTVEEDGRVSSVQVTTPSRWPLLNQEATRAVRQTLFSPGPKRIYDVPIDFHLNR